MLLLCASLQELILKIPLNPTGFAQKMPQTLQRTVSAAICGILRDYLSCGHAQKPKVSVPLHSLLCDFYFNTYVVHKPDSFMSLHEQCSKLINGGLSTFVIAFPYISYIQVADTLTS